MWWLGPSTQGRNKSDFLRLFWTRDTGHGIQDTGYGTRDTDTRHGTRDWGRDMGRFLRDSYEIPDICL